MITGIFSYVGSFGLGFCNPIVCDKAVYVINWYEISQSRKFVVALGH